MISDVMVTLAMRIPFTHWWRVLTSSQHKYFMYWDFFWIWGCWENTLPLKTRHMKAKNTHLMESLSPSYSHTLPFIQCLTAVRHCPSSRRNTYGNKKSVHFHKMAAQHQNGSSYPRYETTLTSVRTPNSNRVHKTIFQRQMYQCHRNYLDLQDSELIPDC